MKRILSVVFCFVILFTFVSCGPSPSAPAEQVEDERITIGVAFFDFSMPLGVDIMRMIDYAAAALDVDVLYAENNFDPEQIITDVENLFAAGANAVIFCNSAEGQVPRAVSIAENYDGKVFQFFRTLHDPEIRDAMFVAPGYGGQVFEDEFEVGYILGMAMAQSGVTNVGLINFNSGDPTAIQRQAGYEAAFAETGVNILAETWDIFTGEEAAMVTENYIAAFPELDGIVLVGGSTEALRGIQSTLQRHDKTGDIALSTTDFYDEMYEDLESGSLQFIAGGHWNSPFFAFMLAYNWASGAFTEDELPAVVANNMMFINSIDDARAFNEYFMGEVPPFNTEEIRQLSINHNPDFVLEDLIEAAANLSIEDVERRRQ